MDTSPTLSIGGSRARAALLTTSGTGTGSTDRRVVFLASQPSVGSSHETKTWPHHWSPHTVSYLLPKAYILFDFETSIEQYDRKRSLGPFAQIFEHYRYYFRTETCMNFLPVWEYCNTFFTRITGYFEYGLIKFSCNARLMQLNYIFNITFLKFALHSAREIF